MIKILDIYGQEIESYSINTSKIIDFFDYKPGMYFVQFDNIKNGVAQKIILN